MSMPPGPYQQPWPQGAYPGHAGVGKHGGASRWIIPSVTGAGGLVAGLVIGLVAGATGTTAASGAAAAASPSQAAATAGPQGYQVASVLEHALRSILVKRLANPAGQYYDPGVTVKSVTCIEQSKTSATCLYRLSSGQSDTDSVAISADGGSFVTK